MSEDLNQLLNSIGLSQKEALIYLTLLELGEVNPPKIAEAASLKRSTVNSLISELTEKEVVIVRDTGKRSKMYRAVSPHVLLNQQKKITLNLEKALPSLLQLNNLALQVPQVEIYAGASRLKELWGEMITADTDILFFADQYLGTGMSNWIQTEEEGKFYKEHIETRIINKIWTRAIYPYNPNLEKENPDLKKTQDNLLKLKGVGEREYREINFISASDYPFHQELTIFNNKVVITAYEESLAYALTSQQLSDLLRQSFKLSQLSARTMEANLLSDRDKAIIKSYAIDT